MYCKILHCRLGRISTNALTHVNDDIIDQINVDYDNDNDDYDNDNDDCVKDYDAQDDACVERHCLQTISVMLIASMVSKKKKKIGWCQKKIKQIAWMVSKKIKTNRTTKQLAEAEAFSIVKCYEA